MSGVETSGREAKLRLLGNKMSISLKMTDANAKLQNHGFFFNLSLSFSSIFAQIRASLEREGRDRRVWDRAIWGESEMVGDDVVMGGILFWGSL